MMMMMMIMMMEKITKLKLAALLDKAAQRSRAKYRAGRIKQNVFFVSRYAPLILAMYSKNE
jgi:hypothetical protein